VIHSTVLVAVMVTGVVAFAVLLPGWRREAAMANHPYNGESAITWLTQGLRVVVALMLVIGLFRLLRVGVSGPSVSNNGIYAGAAVAAKNAGATAPVDSGRPATAAAAAGPAAASPASRVPSPAAAGGVGSVGSTAAWPPAVSATGTANAGLTTGVPQSADGLPANTLHAPRAGTYRYRMDGKGVVSGTVSAAVNVSAGTSQEAETIPTAGGTELDTVGWSSQGRTVSRTVFPDGSVCNWATPLLSLKLPLAVGATWSQTSSCQIRFADGSSGTLQDTEQVKVDDSTQATVGGLSVPVWAIERHHQLSQKSARGSMVTETQGQELFAPSAGLTVYRVFRATRPDPDGQVGTVTTTTELLSATPG
jgi:hypothetical protein